ncbi:MAG: hypothetical protein O3A87_10935, partial [Verrucomicrobia bacterium]|nr:hypothetical protein [Verrucomicrobiota bacterium]
WTRGWASIVSRLWEGESGGDWVAFPRGGMIWVGQEEGVGVVIGRSGRWRGEEEGVCMVEAERKEVRKIAMAMVVSNGPARRGARWLDGKNGGVPIMKAAG